MQACSQRSPCQNHSQSCFTTHTVPLCQNYPLESSAQISESSLINKPECHNCACSSRNYCRSHFRRKFTTLRKQWSTETKWGLLNTTIQDINNCGGQDNVFNKLYYSPGEIRQMFGIDHISQVPEYCQPAGSSCDPRHWKNEPEDIEEKSRCILDWCNKIQPYIPMDSNPDLGSFNIQEWPYPTAVDSPETVRSSIPPKWICASLESRLKKPTRITDRILARASMKKKYWPRNSFTKERCLASSSNRQIEDNFAVKTEGCSSLKYLGKIKKIQIPKNMMVRKLVKNGKKI